MIDIKSIPNEDQILESLNAIVHEVKDTTVRLKLREDVFATFPRALFSGLQLYYGQLVVYSIRRAADGTRFQHFEPDVKPAENPYKDQTLEILNSIKSD